MQGDSAPAELCCCPCAEATRFLHLITFLSQKHHLSSLLVVHSVRVHFRPLEKKINRVQDELSGWIENVSFSLTVNDNWEKTNKIINCFVFARIFTASGDDVFARVFIKYVLWTTEKILMNLPETMILMSTCFRMDDTIYLKNTQWAMILT